MIGCLFLLDLSVKALRLILVHGLTDKDRNVRSRSKGMGKNVWHVVNDALQSSKIVTIGELSLFAKVTECQVHFEFRYYYQGQQYLWEQHCHTFR